MATRRRQRFILGQAVWMLGTLVAMAALASLSLGLWFVFSLIGLLVFAVLTEPFNLKPQWRVRLRWVIVGGLIVFGYIVLRRILAIAPPGLF